MRRALVTVPLVLAGCVAPLTYDVRRTTSPPSIDGVLDDAAWDRAPRSDRFGDIEGESAPRPHLATFVRLLWDDENLYVAAEMEEPDVWATVTDHDAVVFHDDDFEVFLDPDGDGAAYVEWEVNAFGTVWDLWMPVPYSEGGRPRTDWESGARVAVHVHGTLGDPSDRDHGWTVEMAVPWRGLAAAGVRRPPRAGDVWRANFARVEWSARPSGPWGTKPYGARASNWAWSPQGVVDMHRPDLWGTLRFTE